MRNFITFSVLACAVLLSTPALTRAEIVITPQNPLQGDPVMIQVKGKTVADIARITIAGKSQYFFNFNNQATVFFPIDLNAKVGNREVKVLHEDGTLEVGNIQVKTRDRIVETFTIPEKLGGNTKESQQKLVTTLAQETDVLKGLKTVPRKLWVGDFEYPVKNPVVTDTYGYGRETGTYTIPHKGIDFKAKIGTPIYAMNSGVVRLATESRNYGKVTVIDHGLGLMTLYLHQSKISVKLGQSVRKGQQIGLSGDTGYVTGPHLHVSVRINQISIDPAVFLDFFAKVE